MELVFRTYSTESADIKQLTVLSLLALRLQEPELERSLSVQVIC